MLLEREEVDLNKVMRKGNLSTHYESMCKQYVKKFVAIISVKTPTDVIAMTSRDVRVSFMDKVGIIGGTLGLFHGFSFITVWDGLVALISLPSIQI